MQNVQTDRATTTEFIDRASTRPIVDMAKADEVQSIFNPSENQDRRLVSSDGQLIFHNPFEDSQQIGRGWEWNGGKSDLEREAANTASAPALLSKDSDQSTAPDSLESGSAARAPVRPLCDTTTTGTTSDAGSTGNDASTSLDQSTGGIAGLEQQILKELQAIEGELQQITNELSQLLGVSGNFDSGTGDSSVSGSQSAGSTAGSTSDQTGTANTSTNTAGSDNTTSNVTSTGNPGGTDANAAGDAAVASPTGTDSTPPTGTSSQSTATSSSDSSNQTGQSDSTSTTSAANAVPGTVAAVLSQNDSADATTYVDGDTQSSNTLNATRDTTNTISPVPVTANGYAAWGLVNDITGQPINTNATVQVQDMQTWAHLKTGGWEEIQNQDQTSNGSFVFNFVENTNFTGAAQTSAPNANGVASFGAPPTAGQMDHFMIGNNTWTPGIFNASDVDGIYVTADAKASVNNSGLAVKLGGDFYSNATSTNSINLPDHPTGNFTALTDQWQPVYMTTLDQQTLENDPPPGIVSDSGSSGNAAANGTVGATDSTSTTAAASSDNAGNSATTDSTTTASTASTDSTNTTTAGTTGEKFISIFPSTQSDWQALTSDAPKGSLIVALPTGANWNTDQPFQSLDPTLTQNISDAGAAGLDTLGYVGTLNGTKPISEVEAEINSWYNSADVKGIYLGDSGQAGTGGYATDPASEAYFEQLASYIHSKGGLAVINGGGTPNPDYMNAFDVQGTFEGDASNYATQPAVPAWESNYAADRFAVMLTGVPQSSIEQVGKEAEANHNGYIALDPSYEESATTSPSYWTEETAFLNNGQ